METILETARQHKKEIGMKEQTFLQRILLKILKKIGLVKEFEVDKANMCKRAVESGVCPKTCEICAWNEKALP